MHNESDKQVWVVIPAYNDKQCINDVIRQLEEYAYNVVVVDDGSDEPLANAIESTRVAICRHSINLGQGAALQTGLEYALNQGAQYLVTFDADGQHSVHEIGQLLAPILSGECDIALGSRFLPGARTVNLPNKKLITLKVAIAFTRLTTGLTLSDTHNGFRAMSRKFAENITITLNRMAHASQILYFVRKGNWKYKEVPVTITYTEYSLKKGQKISNALNILWEQTLEKLK